VSPLSRSLCNYGLRWLSLGMAFAFLPAAGFSQEPEPIGVRSKLSFHLTSAYGPTGIAESAVWAGYRQEIDSPREWGQGGAAYGKRFGSTLAYSGVRNLIGFGLDSSLHQDPRYYRSTDAGFWRRSKHAIRATILTRKDSGGETFAMWRFGSAYSAAFISNEWHPDRVNTVGLSLKQGSAQIGFDLLANVGSEFWPDVKRKIFHHER
jgi:hypothetical protein